MNFIKGQSMFSINGCINIDTPEKMARHELVCQEGVFFY